MTIEALITMILVFGICLGGFILFLYLSSKEN
jgi:GMP synthase-like glutamine amidotransferase